MTMVQRNQLIMTNIFGCDIPGIQLMRKRRPDKQIPKIVILEKTSPNGKVELRVAINGLNAKDAQSARCALKALATQLQYVPEGDLYAKLNAPSRR